LPTSNESSPAATADQRFRDAFERLKLGVPRVLPKGTQLSQNNVAKEAGCKDPSALRKSRFPLLVLDIQVWIDAHKGERPVSKRQKLLAERSKKRDMRQLNKDFKNERDILAGLLADADFRIIELAEKLADVQARLDEFLPQATVLHLEKKED
jgi:hypothetical protein